MTEPSSTEQRAIEAVARHVAAPWEWSGDPPSAFVTLDRRRIAVAVATVPGQPAAKARLRDDRVARRFLSDLEAAIGARTPEGRTVILTLGAPIRAANQTLAALTEAVLARLASGVADVDERVDILGNRVRFRIVSDGSMGTKAIGFVFTGDPRPGDLAEALFALHDAIETAAVAGARDRFAGDWWLVLSGHWIADIKTYRRAFARRSVLRRFEKILLFEGGRIELLVD